MRYASLASGSRGNCHAVCDGEQILLIDVGISLLQIKKRLGSLNWHHEKVRGVAITHEHSDHSKAIPVILRNTNWTILATPDTLWAIEADARIEIPKSRWIPLSAGKTTNWLDWHICPFAIPHDAADPIAYRIETAGHKLAIMTDLGHVTTLVVDYAKNMDILVVESNHDIEMLREGHYPPDLKRRILSRIGHLSNDACADYLSRVISPSLKHIVLAHLSEQNNDPALAKLATSEIIEKSGHRPQLHVALQGTPLEIALA